MVRPVVEAAGLELVEASFVREQGRRILRVTVDREPGVDLETIGEVSERISRRLDLEGFDPGPYHLEVGSPGIERPLRAPRDFERQIGRQVRLKLTAPLDGSRTVSGRIMEAGPTEVRIAAERGERTVSYDDIATARTVFEWSSSTEGGRT